ncbi:MAG: lytic transglycosylase domain-containing protein [Phyllobacteriaceae bacterium]|nr:lytic transglycosylase domain-containing protein [Phyllobacteriaceae bacterium]
MLALTRRLIRGSTPRLAAFALGVTLFVSPVAAQDLTRALAAASRGDGAAGNGMRGSLDRIDQKIVDWYLIRMGSGLPSQAITAFAIANSSWPDPELFRKRAEQALEKERPSADDVIAAFQGSKPYSDRGRIMLARALVAKGRKSEAAQWARYTYRDDKLTAEEQRVLETEFGDLLGAGDYKARFDMAVLKGHAGDAQQAARKLGGGYEALARAQLAVDKKQGNAGSLLDAVPGGLRDDPIYIFARAQYARRMERWQEAADWLVKAPKDPKQMGLPDDWWEEKRIVSRKLLDMGDAKTAYRVVVGHTGSTPANQAEADFHAGWYALRFLKDPSSAMRHFAAVAEDSSKPVTRARAYYWMGRAAEAGGGGSANDYYRRAGEFGFTFYGQMARAKLGKSDLGFDRTISITSSDQTAIDRDDRFEALRRFARIGRKDLATTFAKHMAETLRSPGEIAALIDMMEKQGWMNLAVTAGKAGAQRGMDMEVRAFPIGFSPNVDTSGLEKSLAFAIMRQESEFNQSVVSSAGATGIFQVMPDTGRDAAKYLNIAYNRDAWRNDPAYNIRLGAAYVARLVDNYDGNYVMAIAGYNAGPGRIRDWVKDYGDPRTGTVDVVDWMERIPFSETRNYVQRVLENLQVYRYRLDGQRLQIAQDLQRGVGARAATTGSLPAQKPSGGIGSWFGAN